MSKHGLRIADALVLDPTREFKPEQLATFGDPDNPLHNLGHNTVYFLEDDSAFGGPNSVEFVSSLNNHGKGHTHLLAELTPGVTCSPKTVIIPTVTMGNMKAAVDMWGIGQEAVGHAISDLVRNNVISKDEADKWLCWVQVYIDPANFSAEAGKPNTALWEAIYRSTYLAGKAAWEGKQDVEWMLKNADKTIHPFGLGSTAAIAAARKHAATAPECIVLGEPAP